MNLFNKVLVRHIPVLLAGGVLLAALPRQARALAVSGTNLTNTTISAETVGTSTATTIQFNLSGAADVQIQLFNLAFPTTPAVTITQSGAASGANNLFWSGLWFLGGDFGRIDGTYQVVIIADDGTSTSAPVILNQNLVITSVDIHNVSVTPSMDSNQKATSPYTITYSLAKASKVTIQVRNNSGPVRTLFANQNQSGETEGTASNTAIWNGLGDDGHPVPLGIYTITIDANDAQTTDKASQRSRTATVQSLAGAASDPQQLIESNTYVYPNPVRNNQATFQLFPVRDNATITLKIYTIAGDLVWDQTFGNLTAGSPFQVPWNAVNQSGKNVGRGLYYYVVRETDSTGTLQTVKKLAVIK